MSHSIMNHIDISTMVKKQLNDAIMSFSRCCLECIYLIDTALQLASREGYKGIVECRCKSL